MRAGGKRGGGGGVRVSEEMRWASAFVPHIYKHLSFLPMWLLCNVQLFGTALVCGCVCQRTAEGGGPYLSVCVCARETGEDKAFVRTRLLRARGGAFPAPPW